MVPINGPYAPNKDEKKHILAHCIFAYGCAATLATCVEEREGAKGHLDDHVDPALRLEWALITAMMSDP